jgi:4-amino-4-deoxy-L-arabinose transferase-like glycosyltransferase
MNERPANLEHPHRRSIALIVLTWLVLQVGGMFSPGLLDDVDSIYIEIAREMLHRHDYVTPYIDGIRFFDKPPLTGPHDCRWRFWCWRCC